MTKNKNPLNKSYGFFQLKNNFLSDKLWFKAKRYGWGWYPVTWEGWSVILIYILFIFYRSNTVSKMFDTESSFMFRYSFELVFMTVPLIIICLLKGERPKWRWGNKK